jgi:hypothetical protein
MSTWLPPADLRSHVYIDRAVRGVYAKLGFTPLSAPDRWMALGE